MNMEVRDDIAEQQIVDMTRLENVFDGPPDILNVRRVMRELVWRKIGEGRDMSAPEHDCHMAGSYGVPFKKSLTDSAAMEGLAGQIGTKRTSDTPPTRFPVLRPGSFHVMAPYALACSICPTCIAVDRQYHFAATDDCGGDGYPKGKQLENKGFGSALSSESCRERREWLPRFHASQSNAIEQPCSPWRNSLIRTDTSNGRAQSRARVAVRLERGTVHNDEQTSGADRVFAFEVK